jgi:hypothetical protein
VALAGQTPMCDGCTFKKTDMSLKITDFFGKFATAKALLSRYHHIWEIQAKSIKGVKGHYQKWQK